ncbi:MAG: gluconokinase [Gemmataceae bacterium]
MIVVLMGVSGSGKTTVGRILARSLGWPFLDADDYHPAANIEKMTRGVPLDDADRRPWLETLRRLVDEACDRRESIVLACSALKHSYQEYIRQDIPTQVRFVYLSGSEELIRRRLAARTGHFMNPALLHSQFEILEPPDASLRVDVAPDPETIVAEIRHRLDLSPSRPTSDAPERCPQPQESHLP